MKTEIDRLISEKLSQGANDEAFKGSQIQTTPILTVNSQAIHNNTPPLTSISGASPMQSQAVGFNQSYIPSNGNFNKSFIPTPYQWNDGASRELGWGNPNQQFLYDNLEQIEEKNKRVRVNQENRDNEAHAFLLQVVHEEKQRLDNTPLLSYQTQMSVELPKLLLDKCLKLNENKNFPPELTALMFLTALSGSFHGRILISPEDNWLESGNLSMLPVAASGTHKSAVINKLKMPFKEHEESRNEDIQFRINVHKNTESSAALYKKQSTKRIFEIMKSIGYHLDFESIYNNVARTNCELDQHVFTRPHPVKLLVDDVTPFQLHQMFYQQGESLTCLSAEQTFPVKFLLGRNADPAFFNCFFSQESYEKNIRGKLLSLKHPSLSLLTFAQPILLEKLYKDDNLIQLGTMARFLPYFHNLPSDFCVLSHRFISDDEIKICVDALNATHRQESLKDVILRNLQNYHTQDSNAVRHIVRLTPQAVILIKNFEQYIKLNVLPVFPEDSHGALRKLHGQALRIALAIHTCCHDVPHKHLIDEYTLGIAIAFCEYLLPHINYAYSPFGLKAYTPAKKILESLKDVNLLTGKETLANGYIKTYVLQQRTKLNALDVRNGVKLLSLFGLVTLLDNGEASNCVVVSNKLKSYNLQ